MTISMYSASVPVFKQMLHSLSHILAKTAQHAENKKIDPEVFLQARLAPDMFPLIRQVQIAADFAKGVCARLADVEVPAYDDQEKSVEDLQARITTTLAFIESLDQSKFTEAAARQIITRPGTPKEKRFTGLSYLLSYGLPQFFFHVTTTYAIARHNGVEIGKGDFMGL